MEKLTEHFSLEEFQKGDAIPQECEAVFHDLAAQILEPVREQFNLPLVITSGYRSPRENAEAHGQPNSEHMATADMCACDFYAAVVGGVRPIFDWMRQNGALPFHQLILEHGANGSSVIHVSINRLKPGLRSVLEGATHNSEPYIAVDHVPFDGQSA